MIAWLKARVIYNCNPKPIPVGTSFFNRLESGTNLHVIHMSWDIAESLRIDIDLSVGRLAASYHTYTHYLG